MGPLKQQYKAITACCSGSCLHTGILQQGGDGGPSSASVYPLHTEQVYFRASVWLLTVSRHSGFKSSDARWRLRDDVSVSNTFQTARASRTSWFFLHFLYFWKLELDGQRVDVRTSEQQEHAVPEIGWRRNWGHVIQTSHRCSLTLRRHSDPVLFL